VEYLLLRSAKKQTWDLPKGKLEEGETPLTGARRETYEETGLSPALHEDFAREVAIQKPAKPTRAAYVMQVQFYLGEVAVDAEVRLSHEHDAFRWEALEEACELLHRAVLADVLVEAHRALDP
jgi:bis(5'-nucleosidyl)-tetraphosphatase